MELSKKKLSTILSISVILSCLLTYAVTSGTISSLIHGTSYERTNVTYWLETDTGVYEFHDGNVITDIGERWLRNVHSANNESAVLCKSIALGNDSDTTDVTATKLDTEATTLGFTRANGTVAYWVNAGDYAYNVTLKFTAGGVIAINAAALHWSLTSNSDNNIFAMFTLGGTQAFQNMWNITIRWSVTFNAN